MQRPRIEVLDGIPVEDLLKLRSFRNKPADVRLMRAVAKALIKDVPRHQETPNSPRVARAEAFLRLDLGFPALFQPAPPTTELARAAAKVTLLDLFTGIGGVGYAAVQTGIGDQHSFNHWPESVATHAINIPGKTWLCDLMAMRDILANRLRPQCDDGTDAMVPADLVINAAPCPPHSSARRPGKDSKSDRRTAQQRADALSKARTAPWAVIDYVTMFRDVVKVVVTENVPGFLKWPPFPAWIEAWDLIGFHTVVCSENSLFAGPADLRGPQSRDRVFCVHIRKDLLGLVSWDFTVDAECRGCRRQVQAYQKWKSHLVDGRAFVAGIYGDNGNYVYACPRCHERVYPKTRGVEVALDLADLGTPIAERTLGATTMARIDAGIRRLIEHGLPPQPLLVTQDRSNQPDIKPGRPVSWPSPTLTARQVLGIASHPDLPPFGTTTTPATKLPPAHEWTFRMVTPSELARIQGLPSDYYLGFGSKRDAVIGIGNAVPINVAKQFIDRSVMQLAA